MTSLDITSCLGLQALRRDEHLHSVLIKVMEKYYVKCGIRERSFKFDGNRKELRQLIFTLLSLEFGVLRAGYPRGCGPVLCERAGN